MPSWLKIVLIVLLVVVLGAAIAAPIGPMPGFRIGGNDADAPEQWSSIDIPGEVRLASYSGLLPHVVIIWIVESDNRLYVIGDPASAWVEGATNAPDVRLRMGDNTYDMRATRLQPGPQEIFLKYINRYKDDYPEIIDSFPPPEEFATGAALFELTRR
jgi:hypothetical protein